MPVLPTITGMAGGWTLEGMPFSTDPPAGGGPPAGPYWQQVQTLGVAEVVMTILEARKTMPSATAAAIRRESDGGGFRVRVSFLEETASEDEKPGHPEGDGTVIAIFVAGELGRDLTDAFGDRDVIILR